MSLQLSSEAFRPNSAIPGKYSGDGENASPPLKWSGVPNGTRELALIVDDPDAPQPEPFVHWVIYKVPPTETGLPEGVAQQQTKLIAPAGALQGKNSFNRIGYGGPAPPRGHGTHHYHFRLFALDEPLEIRSGLDKESLLAAMSGHVLDEAELIGTYQRQ